MIRRKTSILALAVLGAVPALAAQDPASPAPGAPASPQAQEIARILVPEETWNKMLDNYATTLSERISGALGAKGQQTPKDLSSKIRSDVGRVLPYKQATQLEAQALTQDFTPLELGSLVTFYKSPAGEKALHRLPGISRQVSDELETRLGEQLPQIVKKYAPSLVPPESTPESTPGPAPAMPPSPK